MGGKKLRIKEGFKSEEDREFTTLIIWLRTQDSDKK